MDGPKLNPNWGKHLQVANKADALLAKTDPKLSPCCPKMWGMERCYHPCIGGSTTPKCHKVVGPRLIDGRGFWVVLGGADNVLGCPPYKIFSWTCCYAIHSSLAPYPGTRYQLLLVTCKTLLIFALLFLGGVLGGLITFLAAHLTRYSLGLAATLSTLLLHRTLAHAINFFL